MFVGVLRNVFVLFESIIKGSIISIPTVARTTRRRARAGTAAAAAAAAAAVVRARSSRKGTNGSALMASLRS